MARIHVAGFTGEIPKMLAKSALPDNAALSAINCDFRHGQMLGVRSDAASTAIDPASKTVFKYDGDGVYDRLYAWDRDVDAVRSPIPQDKFNRYYWTNGDNFIVSSASIAPSPSGRPMDAFRVGVPRPATPPILTNPLFNLPLVGVPEILAYIYDERTDGTLENKEAISASWVVDGARQYIQFEARNPQKAGSGGQSSVSDIEPSSTGMRIYGTGYAGDIRVIVYQQGGSDKKFAYFESSPLPDYFSARVSYEAGWFDEYGQPVIQSSDMVFYRCTGSDTRWYCADSIGQLPPTSSATVVATEAKAPFSGAVVELLMKRWDGVPMRALVRAGGQNTWPDELPNHTSLLTHKPKSESTTISEFELSISRKDAQMLRRSYVVCFVNDYGEEGPPSPPLEVDCYSDTVVPLAMPEYPQSVAGGIYRPLRSALYGGGYRVYRTSSTASYYMRVAEVVGPLFDDDIADSALGAPIPSMNSYPPAQNLVGLCMINNGIMAAFYGSELWFSDPYLPYSFNPNNIKPLPYKIMGIAPYEGGLYVTTTGPAFIVAGASPDAMQDVRVPNVFPGVSRRSISSVPGGIAYATTDGIVMANGLNSVLQSQSFFTRETWRDNFPQSVLEKIRITYHDNAIFIWTGDQSSSVVVIDMDGQAPYMTRLSDYYGAVLQHNGEMYVVKSGVATLEKVRFGYGRRGFSWASKVFTLPKPESMGAIQVVGSGTLRVSVFADNFTSPQEMPQHVADNMGSIPFNLTSPLSDDLRDSESVITRLPSGFKARKWQIVIDGDPGSAVQSVTLASSMSELLDV